MSVLNPASDDESPECPLCMEFLELDDISFYPCACGYQVRFAIVSKSGGCSPQGQLLIQPLLPLGWRP